MKALKLFGFGVAVLGAVACGGPSDLGPGSSDVRSSSQAITAAQARILGFEAPSADWSTTNGSAVGSSTMVTQGSAALTITPNGYTELKSAAMPAVGAPAASKVTFDMQIPKNLSWGTVEVVFKAPSKGLWWTSIGTVNLGGSTSNGYRNFSLNMPAVVKTTLEGNATDITFSFVINGPAGAQYKLDNLAVGGNMGPPPPPPPPIPRTLSLNYPRGFAAGDLLISATRKVTIGDRSTLSRPGEHPIVASVGPDTSEFGAEVDVYADILSQGDVDFVRSQAHVYGNVTTAGEIDIQDGSVVITGTQTEHAPVTSLVTNFTVMWPSVMTQVVHLDTDRPNLPVSPGAYDRLRVGSRSTVTLRSGEYFFKSVVFEPQSHFRVDASRGPVRIYVENELRLNVPLEYIGGRRGHVLFGYLGTVPATFEEHLVATVLAPNSTIELRRPASGLPHGGQFFGKNVQVYSDATVLHVPYPFDFVCPAGDSDKDGTFDCWDECPDDPKKTQMGVCNCGSPDTDTDADGVADCVDQAKEDPDNTYVGQCGQEGVNAAPAGTPCTDGVQQGAQVCNGQGTCGNPNSDAPEAGCKLITYDNRAFWLCPGTPGGGSNQNDALAKCAAAPGRALVRIDHRIENYLVASLARKVGAAVRIGAVDLNGDGNWAWADKTGAENVPLWTGGPTGKAYHGMYNSWSGGAPAASTTSPCAILDASGAWTVDNCATPRPYVCEQTFGDARYPNGRIPEDEPLPTPVPYVPVSSDCVDLPDPYDDAARAQMNAEINACDAACASAPDEATCRAGCSGAAEPPLAGENCGSTGPGARTTLDAFEPRSCSTDAECNTGGGVGRTCGFGTVCYALELVGAERKPIACTNNSQCPAKPGMATGICDLSRGLTRGECLHEGIEAACDVKSGNDCMAACVEVRGCGVRPVTNNVDAFTGPCREVEYCSAPYEAPMENTDLTEGTAFNKAQLPDEAGIVPAPYPDDFASLPPSDPRWDTCADSSAGCDRSERHPWCNYNASSPGSPTAGATDNKSGVRGKDSTALKVTFDPGADLKFETTPLPFGVSRFDALASVSATSDVKFKLLAFEGSVELLDLRAELEASICRVTTKGSRLALLGLDFLPAVAGDTGVLFDSDEIAGLSSEKCEKAIATYVDAVDRAKKALRDAQELVKQYKEALPAPLRDIKTRADLAALGSVDPATLGQIHTFADDFCEDLLGPEDKRPPGMKGSCAQESDPSATINRFIEYYQQEARSIDAVKKGLDILDTRKLLTELIKEYPALASLSHAVDDYSYAIDLVGLQEDTETTILSVQFFIGPIPALLQVGARVYYGVSGGFLLELQPKSLINGSGPIASAGATVTPNLGSDVTLFAGAGFSAGPLELSLGLTAALTLVNVDLPASVKAGLNVNSSPETRLTIPANLTSLASSQGGMAYPFNGKRLKYDFSFRYDYGVNLTLSNILAGHLDATAKVKFFFFSLKYSQRLVDFKGLPPVSINLLGGGGDFINTTPPATPDVPEPRISGHFPDMVLSEQQQPWKATFEEVPFVNVEPLLPLADIVAALPASVPVVRDASFSRARVGDVLYNNQCGCEPLGQACTRNQDCCLDGAQEGSVTCFADPATIGASSFCSECRKSPTRDDLWSGQIANPVYESCNTPENCCDPEARCEREAIPYNCRWSDPGDGFLRVWICDERMPATKVCLPPLPDPWIVR